MSQFHNFKTFLEDRKSAIAIKEQLRSLQQTDREQLTTAQINEAEGNFGQPLEDVFPYAMQPRDKTDYGKGASSMPLHKLDYLPGDHSAIVKLSIATEGQGRLARLLVLAAMLQRLDLLGSKVDKTILGEFMQSCDVEKAAKACTEHSEETGQLLTASCTAFKRFSLTGDIAYATGKFLKQALELEEEMEYELQPMALTELPRRAERKFDQEPKEEKRIEVEDARPKCIAPRKAPKKPSVFGKKPQRELEALKRSAMQTREAQARK